MGKRGFTLLELVIVICIIGLLIAFALQRLLSLRVEAERAAMEGVLGAMRAGVAMELVSLLVRDREHELARLQGSNPMNLLMQVPATYLGEFDAPDPARIPPGRWYFDRGRRLLVYRVRHGDHFETALADPPRARFRVSLGYDDRDADGSFDPGLDGLFGAQVRAVERYRWRKEPSSRRGKDR